MNIDIFIKLWTFAPIFLMGCCLLVEIVSLVLYFIQCGLSRKEKSENLVKLKSFYNKSMTFTYTLENSEKVSLLQDELNNKFTDFKINGLSEFNSKIKRYWDKETVIKMEYTLFENDNAETQIFHKMPGREWNSIDNPSNLMDGYVDGAFKSWTISYKDTLGIKNYMKKILYLYCAFAVMSVFNVIIMNSENIGFNIWSFIESNILYIITVVLISIFVLLYIIAMYLRRNRSFFDRY